MVDEIKIQDFGYSEMYEWYKLPNDDSKLARFVTFSKSDPSKIVLYGDDENDYVLGISTINSVIDSDNPDEWKYKYMVTDTGDILLKKERLAVGVKEYDENLEMAFIHTYPWEHFIKIKNKKFDDSKKYVKRSNRNEWIRINLLGKVLVKDNGKCVPGSYCKPYCGDEKELYGTAIPAEKTDNNSFYVMHRLSNDVIMIINK